MPNYKLIYFNLMGRAEPIRLLFAQARVEYEDKRLDALEWLNFKPSTPFGELPILEVDGKMLSQSHAIEKFLANKFGLAGNDDWEAAKVDELVLGVEDLLQKMAPWFRERSETKKIEIFKQLAENEITPFLQRYESFLSTNGTGYFVGNQVTLADISLFHLLWFFNVKLLPGRLVKYPALAEFVQRMSALPNIKAWLEKRPKTEG